MKMQQKHFKEWGKYLIRQANYYKFNFQKFHIAFQNILKLPEAKRPHPKEGSHRYFKDILFKL